MPQFYLKDLIKVRPGYKGVVNIIDDMNNEDKIMSYLPIESAVEALNYFAEYTKPLAERQEPIYLWSTYGTGKSHLGLIMANLVQRSWKDDKLLDNFKERLKNFFPASYATLEKSFGVPGQKPYLVVPLYGLEQGETFDTAMLEALVSRLEEEGLSDLIPETEALGAVKRISEWEKDYPDTYEELKKELREFGYDSINSLRMQLKGHKPKALNDFKQLHIKICSGAVFDSTKYQNCLEAYRYIARKLAAERNMAGVFVIWDEFGLYIDSVLNNLGNLPLENSNLQRFFDGINQAGATRVKFMAIAHRDLGAYIRMRFSLLPQQNLEEDFEKIAGRFNRIQLLVRDKEIYNLMDMVVESDENQDKWRDFEHTFFNQLEEECIRAINSGLFNDLDSKRIRDTIVKGLFPLQYASSYILPHLAEKVAQNERTLFTYLTDLPTSSGSLRNFVENSAPISEKLLLLTPDYLWDYFETALNDNNTDKDVVPAMRSYHMVKGHSLLANNPMAVRVVKLLTVLRIVNSPELRPTMENLLIFLNCRGRTEIEEMQELMTRMTEGDERIFYRTPNGEYVFARSGSGAGIKEDLEAELKNIGSFNEITYLNDIMPEMGLETAITANAYFNRKNVKRCLRRLFVAIPDLNNWQRFFTQMDKSFEGDGFILIVPVIQGTTAVADNYVKAYSSYDTPYRDLIVVGITTYTLDFLTVLQRHAALKQLKINKESIYGLNGEQEDVWETLMDECEISIKRELRQMVAVQHRRIQYFWRGEKQAIASENLLADEVMQYCYPKTPEVVHEMFEDSKDNSTAKTARKFLISRTESREGPADLWSNTGLPNNQHVLLNKKVFKDTKILRQEGGAVVMSNPGHLNPEIAEIWELVLRMVQQPAQISMNDIVSILKAPPYGIRTKLIPLLLAAILRDLRIGQNLNIRLVKNNELVDDMSWSELLETMVTKPKEYSIKYREIGPVHEQLLQALRNTFVCDNSVDSIISAIRNWWLTLPDYSRNYHPISSLAREIREQVLIPLVLSNIGGASKQDLLLEVLPAVLRSEASEELLDNNMFEIANTLISNVKDEYEKALGVLTGEIIDKFCNTMLVQRDNIKEGLQDWWDHSISSAARLRSFPHPADKLTSLIRALDSAFNDEIIINLAETIIGQKIDSWNRDNLVKFETYLQIAKKNIEEYQEPIIYPNRINEEDEGQTDETIQDPGKHKAYLEIVKGQAGLLIMDYKDDQPFKLLRITDSIEKLPDNAINLGKMLRGAIDGFKRSMSEQELYTVVINVLEKTLS